MEPTKDSRAIDRHLIQKVAALEKRCKQIYVQSLEHSEISMLQDRVESLERAMATLRAWHWKEHNRRTKGLTFIENKKAEEYWSAKANKNKR
mgnify:CR=1 FL=1